MLLKKWRLNLKRNSLKQNNMKINQQIINTYTGDTFTIKAILSGMVAIQSNNKPEVVWFPEEDASLLGYNITS